jgi:hypothetical protein
MAAMTRDDLADGLEALEYWRARRRGLSRLRVGARRECDRMIDAWERRVRAALLRGELPPGGLALQAGLLAVRARAGLVARRWRRRAAVGAAAVGAAAVCAVVVLGALARAVT